MKFLILFIFLLSTSCVSIEKEPRYNFKVSDRKFIKEFTHDNYGQRTGMTFRQKTATGEREFSMGIVVLNRGPKKEYAVGYIVPFIPAFGTKPHGGYDQSGKLKILISTKIPQRENQSSVNLPSHLKIVYESDGKNQELLGNSIEASTDCGYLGSCKVFEFEVLAGTIREFFIRSFVLNLSDGTTAVFPEVRFKYDESIGLIRYSGQ